MEHEPLVAIKAGFPSVPSPPAAALSTLRPLALPTLVFPHNSKVTFAPGPATESIPEPANSRIGSRHRKANITALPCSLTQHGAAPPPQQHCPSARVSWARSQSREHHGDTALNPPATAIPRKQECLRFLTQTPGLPACLPASPTAQLISLAVRLALLPSKY